MIRTALILAACLASQLGCDGTTREFVASPETESEDDGALAPNSNSPAPGDSEPRGAVRAETGADERGSASDGELAPPAEGESGSEPALQARLTSNMSQVDLGVGEVAGPDGPDFTWTVRNVGNTASGRLELQNSNPGDVSTDAGCSIALEVGASCSVRVRFAPTTGGRRSADLRLTDGTSEVALLVIGNGLVRLQLHVSGSGRVTSDTGLDCGSTCEGLFDVADTVTLQATTTNGSNVFFSGWSEGICNGPNRACGVPMTEPRIITATFAPMISNLIFASSQTYPTNLGGVVPYDAACNTLATAAGINNLTNDGFIALISDSTSNFRDRLRTGIRGWQRLDGRAFGSSIDELFTEKAVYNPIRYNELGGGGLALQRSITGTDIDASTVADRTCDDWSAEGSTGLARFGLQVGGPDVWVSSNSRTCGEPYSLTCLGNTKTAPLAVSPAQGKRIWLTTTPYLPGGDSPDARCFAERPPGVTSAAALIAYTGRSAANVVDPAATYVRVDGQVVATGEQLLVGDGLTSGIWQTGDGTYRDVPLTELGSVFTGQTDLLLPGTADTTCNSWSAATGVARTGAFSLVNQDFWSRADGDCSVARDLYCIEE
jgi:hypothetical protein